MIAVVDYGVGNLFSLRSSLQNIGEDPMVTGDPEVLRKADRVILPGVGAFEDAAQKLRDTGLAEVIRETAARGIPLLGICLGMQLLFDKSFEYGEHPGLGLIPGEVRPIDGRIPENLKIPHMGWNSLRFLDDRPRCPLFQHLTQGEYVYFVHSYAAVDCEPYLSAVTDYGIPLTAAVQREQIFGCQFHPEKSGPAGLAILKDFCRL